MTQRTVTIERKYYLAVQDGVLDDRQFDTLKEAEQAYAELSKFQRMGVCIMFRERPM